MKTIEIKDFSEQNLTQIVTQLLAASHEDRVVRLQFSPKDYVTFIGKTISLQDIRKVPELSILLESSLTRKDSQRTFSYPFLMEKILESRGCFSFSKQTYNTAQVIYRF